MREQETQAILRQDAITRQNTREEALRAQVAQASAAEQVRPWRARLAATELAASAPAALQEQHRAAVAALQAAEQAADMYEGQVASVLNQAGTVRSDQAVFMGRWQTLLASIARQLESAKQVLEQQQQPPAQEFALETLDALETAGMHGGNAEDAQYQRDSRLQELQELLGQRPDCQSVAQRVQALEEQCRAHVADEARLREQLASMARHRDSLAKARDGALKFIEHVARLQGQSDLLHAQRQAFKHHHPAPDSARDTALAAIDTLRPQADELLDQAATVQKQELQLLRDLELLLLAADDHHSHSQAAPAVHMTALQDRFAELDGCVAQVSAPTRRRTTKRRE